MATTLVPPDGPLTARIALIGQNPGKTEINPYVNKPFKGYSGNLLQKWWSQLEPPLRRDDIYVDNLVPYMCDPERLPPEELQYWVEQLRYRLGRLTNVNVIVPVGNYSCWALIGKGLVKGIQKKDAIGIMNLRGSIYPYTTVGGRECKVIPTLHPSALFKRDNSGEMGVTKGVLEHTVFLDWVKIARESEFQEVRKPQRTYYIEPSEFDVAKFTRDVEEAGEGLALAVDIESPRGRIECVGFSCDPSWALVVPTITEKEERTFQPYVKRLVESRAQKVFQNGLFDSYWLYHYGCEVRNYLWDLMYMHVVVDPVNKHSLDFLSSVYLPFHQYWKDHAKAEEGTTFKWSESREDLLVYNGMDVCISRELLAYLQAALMEGGVWEYYLGNVQPLYEPLLNMSLVGIRVDLEAVERLRSRAVEVAGGIRERLKVLAGEDLIAKKEFSRVKLLRYFHETLKLPKRYKLTKKSDGSKSKSVALDAIALARLASQYKVAREPAQLVVSYRGEMKALESWLNPGKVDEDGYVRAQYRPVTEACRLASSAHPMGKCESMAAKGRKKEKGKRKKGEWVHYSAEEVLENGLEGEKKRKCKCKPKLEGWDVWVKGEEEEKMVDRGYNLQNTKRELREIYLPDKGCLLLEIDQCLTGNTLIETTWGAKAIKDLRVGDKVFSVKDRIVCSGEVTAHSCTGVKEICRVVIDSGEYVDCSLLHRFLVIRREGNGQGKWRGVPNHYVEEIEAKNLKPGDRLVPLRKTIDKTTGYEWLYSRSTFKRTPTHELVAEAHLGLKPEGMLVHHVDENKLNNAPNNFRYLTKPEHNGHHNGLSRVDNTTRIAALREALKGRRSYKGEGNPNYGKKSGTSKICPVCDSCFYVINSNKNKIYCCRDCYHYAAEMGLNHRVREVIFTNKREEVYSITVEPEHNYALAIGVFVKNSQIEDRMCKMYTGSARMVELANMHPSKFDVHRHNGSLIFRVPEDRVTKEQRFLGKVTSHGAERGMTGNKLSDKLLADFDLLIPPDECQGMIDSFLQENWEIRDIFFPWVRQEIMQRGRLVNSWGAVWDVRHENFDDDLYRRGYSFPMQSEAACWMFAWGLRPVWEYLKANWHRLHSRINIPRHDALVMSVPFEHLYEVAAFTLSMLERNRLIFGNWLLVPATVKVGKNDGEGIEFKSLPGRLDFMNRVEEEVLKCHPTG